MHLHQHGRLAAPARRVIREAGADERRREVGERGHADAAAVQVRAAALRRGVDVAPHRVGDHPDHRVAVDLGGDRHAEAAAARRGSSWCRRSGRSPSGRRLVPTSAVPSSPTMPSSGRALRMPLGDERLGSLVHLGDHVGRGRLRHHARTGSCEAVDEQRACVLRELRREREERGQVRDVRHRSAQPRPHRRRQ